MISSDGNAHFYSSRTRSAFMWTHILNTPFWAIYCMLPFILHKDLHATAWQITILIALKPSVSLFSLYWSSYVNQRRDRLVSSVIWAGFLGHLPFFFFPWMENPWFFVISSGIYMLLNRGIIPAWMEILKLNLPGSMRQRVFAYSSTLWYLGSALFPFLFGWLLDDYFQAWRWIFPVTALLSLSAALLQIRIPIRLEKKLTTAEETPASLSNHVLYPWKSVWQLIQQRPDFTRFQIGFMLGGSGLIVMQPAFPAFFMDILHLSYTELGVAMTVCKGIGYALSSIVWARWMDKVNIYRFTSLVTFCAALFPLGLLTAQIYEGWIYIAYLLYGVMQAGSELSWKFSGLIFAKEEDSSLFSSVNVLSVGIRGCVAPFVGSLLCFGTSASSVLILGFTLCVCATVHLSMCNRRVLEDEKSLLENSPS